MMFDIESKKAVIVSNLSKNLWVVALILTFMLAAMSMKLAGIGMAQTDSSGSYGFENESVVLPDIINDTANETIVNENYTNETLALPDIVNETVMLNPNTSIDETLIEILNVTSIKLKISTEVKNAQNVAINSKIKFINKDSKEEKEFAKLADSKKGMVGVMSASPESEIDSGTYDIEIVPEESPVKKILINDAVLDKNIIEFIKLDDPADNQGYAELYAIDPTALNFTEATVTVTAKGDELWKCKSWNFAEQICYGSWEKIMDITPGQEYSFTLTADDPGFAEINITAAEHLNENKTFISDIYEQVRAQDDIWSEPIYSNEYVRATFESNMTNGNVINLYVRNNQSLNTHIEIYEQNGSVILGSTLIITETGQYNVELGGMYGYNNVFDISVVNAENNSGAYLEFDYIKDEPGNLQCDTGSTGTCPTAGSPCVGSACSYSTCDCVVNASQTIDNATTYTFNSLTINSGVTVSILTSAAGGVGAQTTGPPGKNDSINYGGNGGNGGDGYTAGGKGLGGNISGGGGGGGTYLTTYVGGRGGYFGGGGGAGAGYAAICSGGTGGAGGGAVTFNCTTLIYIVGTLQANATNGANGGTAGSIGCGGAGGGGGGKISLKAPNVTISGTVQANGGNGGSGGSGGGTFPGGGGGGGCGGFINVSYSTVYSVSGTVRALGGASGLKGAAAGSAADGVNGSAGVVNWSILNTPPVINQSNITSNQYPITSNSTLMGWCNATDADNNNLFYNYQWYKNAALFSSGATSSSYPQGVLVNVANITPITETYHTPSQTNYYANTTSLNGAWGIVASNGFAYVAGYTGDSLTTFNLSNPAVPVQTNYFTNGSVLDGALGVAVSNGFAYVTGYTNKSLTTFNLSNPAVPVQTNYYINTTSLNGAREVSVSNGFAYVTSGTSSSLTTFNLSNPAVPVQINYYVNTTSLNGATGIAVSNGFAYVTSIAGKSLTTFNLSNPAVPVQTNYYTNATSLNSSRGIAVSNGFAYAVSSGGNSLTTFNLSNPAVPVQTNYYTNATSLNQPWVIVASNNFVYVTGYTGDSLTTFNLSNPAVPVQINYQTNATSLDGSLGVAVSNGFVYVTGFDGKSLTTFNLSDFSPTFAAGNNWTMSCQANDGYDVSSWLNSSQINITGDTTAPRWSNPSINTTTIYTNDIVKFNATWTNTALAGYKFAINQTGNWINSSYTVFTGTTNVSENISLIVAPAGTNVTWFFWANDTAGNANQTALQSFVVQVRNTSLAFSVNQTVYHQGRSPGGELEVYIPFQARYIDNNGQPISGATCNVINDETSDTASLTFNATTGNYTGQVNDYMMYDIVNFTATCSKASYNSALNSTTANVWLYYYLWEWENRSYGTFGNYTSTWLRKEIPSGSVYTLTENVSTVIGANMVNEFPFQGLGPNNSMSKNFNFIGTHTARLNMSVNDSQCKPYLCVSYKDIYLNLLAEHCGAEQTISANTPTIIENNLTFNQTFVQGSYFFIKLYLNCSSPVTETVKIYYNYTNEPSNFESHHAEPTAVITSLEAHTQLDANYTVGPNSTQKVYRKTWVSFNNTASNILYVHYFHNPRILVQYTNATIAGTINIYNSTGQLLASDNVSAGAPETAIYNPSTNQIAWDTEYIPAKTKVNETIVRVESAGLHDTEVLFYNTTSMKQWNITLWSIFTPQIAIYNVTAWTNYSAYGVPNNFGFRVNKTNSSGTFDISSQIFVNTTTKVITMPMTSLTQVVYTVTAGDTTPPTVHLISPANGTVTNQPSRVFSCNITNTEIASLALNIWNSTGDLINTNTTDLSGTFNQTNWTFTLPYDDVFKWNCLGYDSSGNSNYSSEGNYTITLDSVAPTINVLECTPSQTVINGTVVCNATITDATGIRSARANVTLPNTTVIWASVNNLSSNYYFTFNYTESEGRYNITWFANDSLGNSNISTGYFAVSSIPSVFIISPHGEVFGQRENTPILTTASDPDGIDTVISQVTLPDGTKVNITLGTGQESDNFDTDSMGIKWVGENSTVNAGQTCIADIDRTASGAAHTSISHCGAPYTDTYCSILSKKAVAGDFDISVSFNATNFTGSDMAINFVLTEEPTSIIGVKQIFMSLGNWTGTGQEYQLYVIATNYSDFVSRRNTNDTYGKFRITRANNTFAFYTWNSSSWFEENMSSHNFSLNKVLYITLQSETSTLNWGRASVNWDNLIINSSNYTFGMFSSTNLTGNYNVTIIANDTLGTLNNTEKTNFTVEFINSPPSTPFVLYPNANSIISGVKNITWSNVLDKEGDSLQFNITLLNTDYSLNSTIASNYGNNQSTNYQWNTALYKDGDYSLKVMVFENASAERLSRSNTLYGNFTIYNTLPAIQFVAPTPASGSAQKTADILINVTASDSHLCLIRVYIYDSSHVIISYLDSSISPANFNFSGYADGLYYFNATATDTLSNLNSTETRNVTIDTIPPTITIISPQNATYNNRTQLVNISASDPNLNTTWFFNGTANETYTTSVYRTFAEGSNTIIAYANDSAGNFNSTSITFSIDSIKPSINFTSPTETPSSLINTRNNVLVNVTANDTNLANITVNLYNSTRGLINSSVSSTNPYFVNFSDLANGLYYFNATARDSANNANSTETRNVTIFYDVKFPLISIAYPQNTTYNTNVSALNYTIVEANLDKCWYSTNLGVTNTTITCGNNVTGLTSTEGSNTWAVWINDTVGNTNSSSVTFSKDTIKPLISITYPQNMTYNTDISRLNYTVSDANLQACWYSTNGGQANTTITCGTNVTGLTSTEGSNTWVVWANDTAGNTNSSGVTFSKDTIPPNITSTLISPYDPAVAYNITLNATATDNIGISGIFVNITLPNTTVITRTLPMANYTIQIAGRHNITFWANDTSGNIGTSADYFIAGISRVNVQFNVINNDSAGLPANLTIYFTGTDKTVYGHNFTGIYLDEHTTLLYDLLFGALDGNISVRLNEVNLSLDNNDTLGLDRTTDLTGYLVTYGINNTYSFTNANVVLSYAGTGYTNENYLGLYRCSSWDFATRTCSGTWVSVTGTQDKTAKTFTLTTTGFSAYSIKQEQVPSPPGPEGPGGGAGKGITFYKFNISITGNCTGKEVTLKAINQISNKTNMSGVHVTVTYDSKELVLLTNDEGIVTFMPSAAGIYTIEFKKEGFPTVTTDYAIDSCIAAEKEKPTGKYTPEISEIYEKAKKPVFITLAIILSLLFILFVIIKVFRMRKLEREFHHDFVKIRRWENGIIREDEKED